MKERDLLVHCTNTPFENLKRAIKDSLQDGCFHPFSVEEVALLAEQFFSAAKLLNVLGPDRRFLLDFLNESHAKHNIFG